MVFTWAVIAFIPTWTRRESPAMWNRDILRYLSVLSGVDWARVLLGPTHYSGHLMQCHAGEIDINIECYVEIVGENI